VELGPPLLQREPDARKAPVAAFGEVTPLYLALMLGVPLAALTVLWNAVWMRRPGRALSSLVLGVAGSVACTLALGAAVKAGANVSLAFFVAQITAVGVGFVLYRLQRSIVRGHRLLQGRVVPFGPVLLGALALQLLAPLPVLIGLAHPLVVLLGDL
jgi:hypothetical protein